ncbi:type II toxin-antitoxin system RelE/ParE family toxin [Cohaesibacter celericrescens]|uniref:Addiction module antitoxin RelB n=1 Tax=Cohaesibacter celericrescens TaxID=2067669 RepID=A0A2N5XRN5_9HYPH|nr:type II toxin-antitoxin system RelE/ParE family toxin [Cohaesibacter celericrescens]PLW77125.1 hypothetical protein C0081_11270 [Cohaesibacter celericrescens]
MTIIRKTLVFDNWFKNLRDTRARIKIQIRLDRLELGNAGDVKPIGDGISEMRIPEGKGYRVYFVNKGNIVIILLCGGDKSSQSRDIAKAKKMAKEVD